MIREAELIDIPQIWELIKLSFHDEQSEYIATGQGGYQVYLEDLVNESQPRSKKLLVYLFEERVAGFMDISLESSGIGFLTRIAVSPEFRGQGLAKKMMKWAGEEFVAMRAWRLDVSAKNVRAIDLYKSLGFETISTKSWICKLIPACSAVSTAPLVLNEEIVQRYRRYGFTQFKWINDEVGVAGRAIKCPDTDFFVDIEKLSKVQATFPAVDRAFCILDEDCNIKDPGRKHFEILRVHRMEGSL